MQEDESGPEGVTPEIDKFTGIAYSHDTRIVNGPRNGGRVYRYHWDRRSGRKGGESTVWVRGDISALLNLFKSWEMRGQFIYTYVGEVD